ncbi:hypothetical protein [Streptomyces sp. SP18BB07]|uniref:hypothetical protein n=1 Tax=Streptomyces sp. SP18BB07 TaxID=3002522 RepID=UPI002E7A41AB|nr:hypothetical protein [Streptomyces sp. SP18BB07]MEE1764363.1 hypothetical protein [Streptomyces sp. SP18BB07]
MGDKNRALKAAARKYMEESGETSLQAAMRHVRREYEQGQHNDDATDDQERMGFDEAPYADENEYRPRVTGTAYFTAWGVQELLGLDQVQQLVQHAEKDGQPDAPDPITCHLCDKPIDVTREEVVHAGIALLQKVQRPGAEVVVPVWTHDQCGHTRVWSWSQLTLERRRRGLPINTADLPPKQHRRGRTPVEDYYVFTAPEGSPPVFYLQPGDAHRHGPLGFRADRLSDGLPVLDLAREKPRALAEWSITADRTGLLYIERKGPGRWYQPPRPWTPGPEWLAAAHYHQSAIFLTAPAGSIPTPQLEAGSGNLAALLPLGREGLMFGARMTITGLV